jgi:hypothetical protein
MRRCYPTGLMRIDAFISFGLQVKMSLQRRIGPIFRASVCDTFNVAYVTRIEIAGHETPFFKRLVMFCQDYH